MDIQYRLSEEIVEVSTDQIAVNKENPLQRSSSINSQQVRKEVERVLKPYNTTSYYLLEFGAESMLVFENIASKVQSIFSTDSIVDGVNYAVSSISQLVSSLLPSHPQNHNDHMSEIQEKLDSVLKQIEAVQEDNRRKAEELEQLKNQVSANNSRISSPKARPVPPPFPPTLDRYSQQAEQSIAQPHTIASPVSHPQKPSKPSSPRSLNPPPSSPPPLPRSLNPLSTPPLPPSVTSNPPSSPPPLPPSVTSNPSSSPPPLPPSVTSNHPSSPPPLPHSLNTPSSPSQQSSSSSNSRPHRNSGLLREIQQASKNVKLRKVPKEADGTPIRETPSTTPVRQSSNDQIREQMIERIRMMEDSEPEEEVPWRESDIF